MARSSLLLYYFSGSGLFRSIFFFIPTTLALTTSLFILFCISTTSNLFTHYHPPDPSFLGLNSPFGSSTFSSHTRQTVSISFHNHSKTPFQFQVPQIVHLGERGFGSQRPLEPRFPPDGHGNYVNYNEVYHDRDIFVEDYKEMNRSFKIYVYPHRRNDPFANVLLPVGSEPGGNYASESYFKKVLMSSHFITKDPTKADLFFLPFSIARLRHDPRIGVGGIQDFIKDYILNISQKYPYWNRTGGADHFYVACHSIGRSAMDKANEVKFNAIQVVCSSTYFQPGYIAHKDACLPQIWPRQGVLPNLSSSNRKKLAFFAGKINSPVREKLLQVWRNDTEIFAHFGRLTTPYADELLGSKFCLHVKGFEVNTARIADSLYYGCVPVIIANYYDLPFADILNWKSFSINVATLDIPLLKKILKRFSFEEYLMLQRNALKVRKHFQWHLSSVDYDAFYMVMYELWLRRSSVRLHLNAFVHSN
ncbi:hypothetical protein SO802_031784 [Lithocarpus litseifolius]|uniref:Exostosin GT47 domain-containing protein n=1 Tax=Lithocarpus litseifolius TaxID=425828 RepID=A0AAW2BMV6_9ROSI